MSETKKPAAGGRPTKKRTRPRPEPAHESASRERHESREDNESLDIEERSLEANAVDDDLTTEVSKPIENGEAEPRHSESREERDRDYDRGERSDSRHQARPVQAKKSDEYLVLVHYDRQLKTFVGTCLEFPELRVSGTDKDRVVREISIRVENHTNNLKRKGESLPDPIAGKVYPDRFECNLSQSLQRKLDIISRQERVSMEQLLQELLTMALDRRENRQPNFNQRTEHRPEGRHHNNRDRDRDRGHHQGNRRMGGGRGRGYHDTMEKSDNFLEYVRNLEKGGWKKR